MLNDVAVRGLVYILTACWWCRGFSFILADTCDDQHYTSGA